MTVHLAVLPPHLSGPAPGWTPRESFSPSQLQAFAGEGGCKRKWALRNLFGINELKKSIATILGTLIHGCLEYYMRGRGSVFDFKGNEREWLKHLDARTLKEVQSIEPSKLDQLLVEAPNRAFAGLHLLPNVKDPGLQAVEAERWIDIDTTRIMGGVDKFKIPGKIDLSVKANGVWYLYDHKSTKGRDKEPWCYVKTTDDLMTDPQAVFYALDVMFRHDLTEVWCRWVYYLTDTRVHPIATHVDVLLRREDLLKAAYSWLLVANEMRQLVRLAMAGQLRLEDIDPPTLLLGTEKSPCRAFGGCKYHSKEGGPCAPEGIQQIGSLIAGARPEKEKDMSLATALTETQALLGTQPPLVPPGNPLVSPEAYSQAPLVPPAALTVGAVVPNTPTQGPPPGFEFGPGGVLRGVAPAGYQYGTTGQLELIPPPPAPPATQVEGKKPKGRPKGSKNQAGDAAPTAEESDVIDRLFEAASTADSPLKTLTIAQLNAIKDVLEAA